METFREEWICWYEYHVVISRDEIGDRGLVFTNSAMGDSAIECLSEHISERLSAFGLDSYTAEIPILSSSRLDLK
jgi:hypothetical protein